MLSGRERGGMHTLSLPYVSITYLFSSFATKALPGLEGAEDKRGQVRHEE
jgi:hypothetical protein